MTATTRGGRLRAAMLLALLVGLLGGALPADAKEKDKHRDLPPETIVSNDGTTVDVGKTKKDKKDQGGQDDVESAPSEGSGNLEDAEGVQFDPEAFDEGAPADSSESIIGSDDRYKITSTTSYPYRAVVRITSSIGQCTGWMIGPDTVATAGHCVHSGGSGGTWARSVAVAPGQNGSYRPYGTCSARSIHSVVGWTSSRNWEYDYGAIKLNCTVGNTVGWFGYHWTSGSLTGNASYIRGYPGDKPAELWGSFDQIRVTDTRKLFYENDTVGGMSGAPVYHYPGGNGPYAMGVHAYGTSWSQPRNSGTRITQAVFNNFGYWKSL